MKEKASRRGRAVGAERYIKVLELFADIGSHLVDMQCTRLKSKEVAVERCTEHSVRSAQGKVV